MMNFKSGNFRNVHLDDGHNGQRKHQYPNNSRHHMDVEGMLYIPDLKRMLISIGQLDVGGHNVPLGDRIMEGS